MAQFIIGIIMVVIGLVGAYVAKDGWEKIQHKDKSTQQTVTGNDNANTKDETAKATEKKASGIRAKMCDNISEEFKKLIKEQVTRWSFHNTGKGGVKTFDGQFIPFSGGYNDQRKNIFFNHIKSFIEDVIKRKIEETVELAKDKKVPISKVLGSTEANLSGGIDTVYHKIQKVDRRLRGGGDPESVPKRDVSFEVKKMNDFLDRQIKIAEDLHFEIHKTGEADKY